MKKETKKKMSRRLKVTIAVLVIIIISVASFQLYEKNSEPKNQITLCKNLPYMINESIAKSCDHQYLLVHQPQTYSVNGSSYHAEVYMVEMAGFGNVQNMTRYDAFAVGSLPSMQIFLRSYDIHGPYSSMSFEITNVVGRYVNETFGNLTYTQYTVNCNHYEVCRLPSGLNFTPKIVNFGSGPSCDFHIKYPGVGINQNFTLCHAVNYTLYYAVTIVPIFHYNYLLSGYVTGKPVTLIYDPNVLYYRLTTGSSSCCP